MAPRHAGVTVDFSPVVFTLPLPMMDHQVHVGYSDADGFPLLLTFSQRPQTRWSRG